MQLPTLTVTGDRISETRAQEILIRTQDFLLTTKDTAFAEEFYALLGVKLDPDFPSPEPLTAELTRLQIEYRCLPLEFLANQRIASQFGGPHGWCSWTGHLKCRGLPVRPSASVQALLDEWQLIARTWPFLRLRCQLYSVPASPQTKSKPIVEYRVADGAVQITEQPTDHLPAPEPATPTEILPARHREVGTTLPRLWDALQVTRHALGLQPLDRPMRERR